MVLQMSEHIRQTARRKPRGRLAVVTALVAIVAFELAYHFPLMQLYPRLFDFEYVDNLNYLRAQAAAKSKDQPLVIALGSSLTAMALRPSVLAETEPINVGHASVYNFGINSANIIAHLLFLQRILHDGIRPDWVLLETWPAFFMLSERNDPRLHWHWPIDRLERRDLPTMAHYHGKGHQLRSEWRAVQLLPWYSHRNRLQNWLVPTWVPKAKRVDHHWIHSDSFGWECFPEYIQYFKPLYPDNPIFVQSIPKSMEYWADKEINEVLHEALLETIALCCKHRIGVVLLWPPESSHYRDKGYPPVMMQRITRWQQRLTEETGVPLIDARDWVDDRRFVEGLHTNPDGATQFTLRLEREVLQPIVAGRMTRAHPPSRQYGAR
jgi:hypothetical protein